MEPEKLSLHIKFDEFGNTNLSPKDIQMMSRPSSTSWQEVFRSVNMPEQVDGLTILDVGGGASDTTAKLIELGADAYAIDPRYKNMGQLKGEVRAINTQYDPKDQREIDDALERFKLSTKTHKDHYLDASAISLPFPDNHFDLVFSKTAVLFYLDVDIGILNTAVDECLRVTKSKGTIRFFPFKDIEPTWPDQLNKLRIQNNQRLFESLKQDQRAKNVELKTVNQGWQLLVITKS
jgi:ubiquinone/menaquinone biosynthesis C-methylase UbiE